MAERLSDDELRAMEERAERATPGPWGVDGNDCAVETPADGADGNVCLVRPRRAANADFIAHARTDLPRLLAEVRALREENGRLRQIVGEPIACRQCGVEVETPRRIYATPVCYACLPPPKPLPLAQLRRERAKEG